VPNGRYLEYIPQLDLVTSTGIRVEKGMAMASQEPGNGIDWDWDAIGKHVVHRKVH
jgi:L-alanine-DL-glutamate epimerase-like enolase superfamily enzyme